MSYNVFGGTLNLALSIYSVFYKFQFLFRLYSSLFTVLFSTESLRSLHV